MNMKMWQRQKNGKPGKWYVTFARGIHKSLGTNDYDKALKIFNELEREHLRGRLVVLEKKQLVLFNDFKKEYLGDGKDLIGSRKPNVSLKTYKADKLAMKKFGEWYGNKPLAGITRKKLRDYKNFLLVQDLEPNSINNYIRHLRYAIREAISCEYITDKTNTLFFDFKQIKVPIAQKIWLEEKDVAHLIATAQKSKYLDMRVIVPLMLYTGMPRQVVSIILCEFQRRADWDAPYLPLTPAS